MGRAFVLAAWVLTAACGESPASTEDRCTAGEIRSCTLPDGTVGMSICRPDFRFGECEQLTDAEVDPIEPDAPLFDARECPDGWHAVATEDGPAVCDAYGEDGPDVCPPDHVHLPGAFACTRVGTRCLVRTQFDPDVPDTAIFVAAGATGGDGTRTAPLGTLDEALAMASSGDLIAVAQGEYIGPFDIPAGVTVRGSCAGNTRLRARRNMGVPGDLAIVHVRSPDVRLENLRLADSSRIGVWIEGLGSQATVENVIIDTTEVFGIVATDGARAVVTDSLIRNVRSIPMFGTFGVGVGVDLGAQLELSRTVIEQVRAYGVDLNVDAGSAFLENGLVRDVDVRLEDGDDGLGLNLVGGTVNVSGLVVERATTIAIAVRGSATSLADVVVRDTRLRPGDGRFGRALHVQFGAMTEARGTLLEGNREIAIAVNGDGSELTLEDAVIRDTAPQADGDFGRALNVDDAAIVDARGVLAEGNHEVAVAAAAAGTLLLTDTIIRDTRGSALGRIEGRGLGVQSGAVTTIERLVLRRNRELSFGIYHDGSSASATHVRIEDTLARACSDSSCIDAPGGTAIGAFDGAVLTADQFLVERAALCGVHIAGTQTVDLTNGTVAHGAIGACIQEEAFDIDRVSTSVRYVENDRSIEVVSLPIPDTT